MSDSNVKALRKSVRAAVQELLPQVLTQELVAELAKGINSVINARLNNMDKTLKDTLIALENRQKDTLGMFVRAATQPKDEQNNG